MSSQVLGFAGVHASLLRSGKVLFFSYDDRAENELNRGFWQIWDPGTDRLTTATNVMGRNLFCSGHCFLPDGRLLAAGGQSNNWYPFTGWGSDHDVHTFDPVSETWTRHSDMPAARYYPTCVTLSDGNALIASGAASRYTPHIVAPAVNINNEEFEVFYWQRDIRSHPIKFNPGHLTTMYPFMQVLPDGSAKGVLWVFSKNEARLFYPENSTWNPTSFRAISPFNRNYPQQGSFVLLPLLAERPDQVCLLVIGGAGEEGGEERATDTAEIFQFDPQNHNASHWRAPEGGNMRSRRFMSDATLLPDGSVLVANGAARGQADHSHDPVLDVELFDSATETWSALAPINRPRLYHSTALLLPDARVLISGNTRHWNPANEIEDATLEIYSPPYLFRGPRPSISQAPAEISYNTDFEVLSPDAGAIQSVVLMRPGSVTHTNNMDQRHLGLSIVRRLADRLVVRAPRDGTWAPPGFYMLFVLNGDRVPSTGRFLRLSPQLQREQTLIVDTPVVVREADYDVDTKIDLRPGDEYAFEASGDIWAGVAFTGRNGPNGWNNIDHDPKFPLHEGPDAHPFCLLGRFGGGAYYFIGANQPRNRFPHGETRRLYLRINDDRPGNGSGQFSCHIRIWR